MLVTSSELNLKLLETQRDRYLTIIVTSCVMFSRIGKYGIHVCSSGMVSMAEMFRLGKCYF